MNNRTRTFHFYNDPGHEWLKVPMKLCKELNILDKISNYSYVGGSNLFLEGDCDAPLLVDAMIKEGIQFKVVKHTTDRMSKIRSYPRFNYALYKMYHKEG